jgi:hypothetical protein
MSYTTPEVDLKVGLFACASGKTSSIKVYHVVVLWKLRIGSRGLVTLLVAQMLFCNGVADFKTIVT